jgi:hypothetical protein
MPAHTPTNVFHMSELVVTHADSTPLDEAVWQAWLAKGRAADIRSTAVRTNVLLWFMAVLLLAGAAFQSDLAPYEVAFRLAVAAGALIAMVAAFTQRQYGFSALFGLIAIAYNLLVPSLAASNAAQRIVAVAAAGCFLACFAARRRRRNDENVEAVADAAKIPL